MKFYIFRHAETYYSKIDIFYGDANNTAEILPESIPITVKLGHYLKKENVDAYYSSPFLRCRQTAEIIEEITNKQFIYDPRLGEEGVNYGKETFEDLYKRIEDFINDIRKKDYQSVAVCSHGWPLAVMRAILIKGAILRKDLNNFPLAGLLIIIAGKNLKEINFK